MNQRSKTLMNVACGYLQGKLLSGTLPIEDFERFCGDWDILPIGTEEPHVKHDPDMAIYLCKMATAMTRSYMLDPELSTERLFALARKLGEKAADGLLTPSTIAILCKEPPDFFEKMCG